MQRHYRGYFTRDRELREIEIIRFHIINDKEVRNEQIYKLGQGIKTSLLKYQNSKK